MPGIIGICSDNPRDTSSNIVTTMQEEITHGSWQSAGPILNNGVYSVSYVNAFESNVNESSFDDDNIRILIDGEIYSFKSVDINPEVAGSQSALQVLYNAYIGQTFKEDLKQVNGFFAAIIYDRQKAKLHLITDRYGLRHLYYTYIGRIFIFASEQNAILKHPSVNYSINPSAPKNFLDNGYLLRNESWFEDINLVPSGSIVTWDLNTGAINIEKYVDITNITPIVRNDDIYDLVDELGEKFVTAVNRQVHHGERIGIGLSGGLDSRALLAAVDELGIKASTYTFGNKDSEEIRIARKLAAKININHTIYEINERNWLKGRADAICWTDGVPGINNLHNVISLEQSQNTFDVKLDGFLGDATIGGSYLEHNPQSEIDLILNRGRRRIISGPKRELNYHNVRLPFFDNDFFDLAMTIPQDLRRNSYIYRLMLLKRFPNLFKNIPCLDTGLPIHGKPNLYPKFGTIYKNVIRRVYLRALGRNIFMADYAGFMRVEPGKTFITQLLDSDESEYVKYIGKNLILNKWEKHMSGENWTEFIGRAVSLEIWLRKLNGKFTSQR